MRSIGLKAIYVWLLLTFAQSKLVPQDEFKVSLYEVNDPIVQLSTGNFKEKIYNQPVAHFVEFYSSWCGHCVNFAPVWLQFSKDIIGWNQIVKPAAINCGVDENMPVCREFSVDSFPSVLYFKHKSARPEDGKLVKDTHNTVAELKQILIVQLQKDQLMNGVLNWPRLRNVDSKSSLADMWNVADSSEANKLVVVVTKAKEEMIAREVALDLSKVSEVSVLAIDSESEFSLSYGIQTFPALLLFDKSRVGLLYQSTGVETRESIKKKVLETFKITTGVSASNEMILTDTAATTSVDSTTDTKVAASLVRSTPSYPYARDLMSGLHNMLTREIPQHKNMDATHVRALKNFMKILILYFPHEIVERASLRKDLELLYDWLLEQTEIQGESWSAKVDQLTGIAAMKPKDQSSRWVTCAGSDKKYRGYSCSLWLMFHTITVNFYLTPANELIEPSAVLESFRDYIVDFFGCRICGEHFKKECEAIREEVKVKKDAVVWLWETHNRVNKRLSGDKHEDPQHPKIQFPSSNSCTNCLRPRGRFDRSKVLTFLVDHYSHLRMGDVYQPGRLLSINPVEKADGDNSWLLFGWGSSVDLSLCLIMWVGSMGVVMFFCFYSKCWRNTAIKKVLRYSMYPGTTNILSTTGNKGLSYS